MATNEGDFKTEFKKDLKNEYPHIVLWTNTDLIRSGLPDISVARPGGNFCAIEVKFVKSLPKKKTSKVLTHEVSIAQMNFLKSIQGTDNEACVLIGMKDVAVCMDDIQENYTLEELLSGRRYEKINGHWQLKGFFE